MSSSGVLVNPECQATFQKMAEGKKEHRSIIFNVEYKEIRVDKAVSHGDMASQGDDYADNSKAAYEEFLAELKRLTEDFTDCRYAVFDFKFSNKISGVGTSKMDKIIFIQLCPDGASIKKKMVYASSASAIKQSLGTGKILQFQVSDESEMSHRELLSKLMDKYSDN